MMYIARFKDSHMAVARKRTEAAAWRAAESHEVPMDLIEVVPESQHESDKGDLPDMGTCYLNQHKIARGTP